VLATVFCCVTVCFGVLATVPGQQMALCSSLTSPTHSIMSDVRHSFQLEEQTVYLFEIIARKFVEREMQLNIKLFTAR
jgi:hypothetical protein